MDFIFEVLPKNRAFFKRVLNEYSLDVLNKVPAGFNNNIFWNIAHVVVTEQILCYKLSGHPVALNPELIARYTKGTKPEGPVSQEDVEEVKALLFDTINKTAEDYRKGHFDKFQEYTVSTTGNTLKSIEDALTFNLYHEGLHCGYVMALLRVVS